MVVGTTKSLVGSLRLRSMVIPCWCELLIVLSLPFLNVAAAKSAKSIQFQHITEISRIRRFLDGEIKRRRDKTWRDEKCYYYCFPQVRGGSSSGGTSSTSGSSWSSNSPYSSSRSGVVVKAKKYIPKSTSNGIPQYHSRLRDVLEEEEKDTLTTAEDVINSFLTRDSRQTFISRVYAVLAGQLLVTAISISMFSRKRDFAIWCLTRGKPIFGASLMISVAVCNAMSLSLNARRKSPTKWFLLSLFTVCEAFTVGVITALYSSKVTLQSVLVTSMATGIISLYTILQRNPKYDLSQWGAGLLSGLLILFFMGLSRLFFNIPFINAVYPVAGAILFSLYLAHHTRLIVSGKNNEYRMNEKDYILGAMTLYLDIINIFLKLLEIFGRTSNDKKHNK